MNKKNEIKGTINNDLFQVGDSVEYTGKHTRGMDRKAVRVAAKDPSGRRVILVDVNGSWFPAFPGEITFAPMPRRNQTLR
jgi:hypothetical protein